MVITVRLGTEKDILKIKSEKEKFLLNPKFTKKLGKKTFLFVAEDKGEIIGYIRVTHGKRMGTVTHFSTKKGHVRKLVGAPLLKKAEERLKQIKIMQVYGSATHSGRSFVKKHGFTQKGTTQFHKHLK